MIEAQFAELFRGRLDGYGTEAGGCDAAEKDRDEYGHTCEPYLDWEPTQGNYQHRIYDHLNGTQPVGIYPLMDTLEVWWGCTDLDNGEAIDWPRAQHIARLLKLAGVNAWIERSRSKGYHVWTFASEPVPAATMRNALLAIHQKLEIPAKEVNPKQTTLEGLKGYGNYVRLPYPGIGTPGRRCVVDPATGEPLTVTEFVTVAHDTRSSLKHYEAVAARYVPPPPPTPIIIDPYHAAALDELVAVMKGELKMSFTFGPKPGHDRSDSLARLAHLCRETDDFTAAEALLVVTDADRRWGKFSERADGPAQLMKLVENAYNR